MSLYGHYNAQYYGNKIKFPEYSFLIAGISHYQYNLKEINYNSNLKLELEPTNKYDSEAIKIIFNNKCIGYVPNDYSIKKICKENIDYSVKIINIKRESESKNYGIRVIPIKYFSAEQLDLGIF